MSPGAPPASADVLLHTKCGVRCIWQPMSSQAIVTFESRETKKTESHVWSRKCVLSRGQSTLRKQCNLACCPGARAARRRCGLASSSSTCAVWWIARSSPGIGRVFEFAAGETGRGSYRLANASERVRRQQSSAWQASWAA